MEHNSLDWPIAPVWMRLDAFASYRGLLHSLVCTYEHSSSRVCVLPIFLGQVEANLESMERFSSMGRGQKGISLDRVFTKGSNQRNYRIRPEEKHLGFDSSGAREENKGSG